ncbi:MAG TPA: N-acetylmuramoyl-L-alanine amidase [Paenibacillus sp.]|uniref:N-acetylmuramoyl-L-alanine amidase n=1 Tax=Paenibacillus sp. TaxID=58172 RepID=UPI0028D33B16|nr:N-acetylmuramoyl-L-alanine amidase [Paenibacillus sp.]HUC93911.1 N-acetylmuramoyl-L-alanine amidase [Paenibacillus sp.]
MRKSAIYAVMAALVWQVFFVAPSVEAVGSSSISYTAKVFADSLNVRSGPAGTAKVIGSLKNGTLVTVLKEANGWLQVRSANASGWVAGYYLKKVDGTAAVSSAEPAGAASKSGGKPKSGPAANADMVSVTAESLRMRAGPGLNHEVVGGLKQGNLLAVLEQAGDWLRIGTAGGGEGWVSSRFVTASYRAASSSAVTAANGLTGKLIVVDPGHGGSDPGMIGKTFETLEKKLNLKTSFYLKDALEARGARVVMTRTDDAKTELSERVRIGDSLRADALVSIHYNSSENKASGLLTFYYADKDEQLARAIESQLSKGIGGLQSNGVAYGDYHILRENDRPAALVELGYLSNPKDEGIVVDASYQKLAAEAVAQGLADYFTP